MYERYVVNCVGKNDVCKIFDAFEEFLLEHPHPWSYFLVTLFRVAPIKAYFGYFRFVQVPSNSHRWYDFGVRI
jgi:hypothetical protein